MSEDPSVLNFFTNLVGLAFQEPSDDNREALRRTIDHFTDGQFDIRMQSEIGGAPTEDDGDNNASETGADDVPPPLERRDRRTNSGSSQVGGSSASGENGENSSGVTGV